MTDAELAIAVNVAWLQPGRVGGTETYARRLLAALSAPDTGLRLHVFGGPTAISGIGIEPDGLERHVLSRLADHRPGRLVVERTSLAASLDRLGADVEHHLGGTVPRRSRRPTVVTVHDLQPLDDPANFGLIKRRWLARALPAAIERADVIVAPSEWVADSIVERFSVSRERVRAVPVFAPPARPSAGASSPVRSILERGPVLFYPAMTMAHKNHRLLFRAFARAARRRADLQLVCVGPVGRDHDAIVRAAAAASSRIHVLGYVSAEDMAALYSGAECMVFPSRYEGFGLPVLEAQTVSLPVVAARAGALPEVAGAGALLLDPDDVDAWVEAMAEPPPAPDRSRMIDAGRVNAARYSPAATASAQTEAYRRAIAAGRRS